MRAFESLPTLYDQLLQIIETSGEKRASRCQVVFSLLKMISSLPNGSDLLPTVSALFEKAAAALPSDSGEMLVQVIPLMVYFHPKYVKYYLKHTNTLATLVKAAKIATEENLPTQIWDQIFALARYINNDYKNELSESGFFEVVMNFSRHTDNPRSKLNALELLAAFGIGDSPNHIADILGSFKSDQDPFTKFRVVSTLEKAIQKGYSIPSDLRATAMKQLISLLNIPVKDFILQLVRVIDHIDPTMDELADSGFFEAYNHYLQEAINDGEQQSINRLSAVFEILVHYTVPTITPTGRIHGVCYVGKSSPKIAAKPSISRTPEEKKEFLEELDACRSEYERDNPNGNTYASAMEKHRLVQLKYHPHPEPPREVSASPKILEAASKAGVFKTLSDALDKFDFGRDWLLIHTMFWTFLHPRSYEVPISKELDGFLIAVERTVKRAAQHAPNTILTGHASGFVLDFAADITIRKLDSLLIATKRVHDANAFDNPDDPENKKLIAEMRRVWAEHLSELHLMFFRHRRSKCLNAGNTRLPEYMLMLLRGTETSNNFHKFEDKETKDDPTPSLLNLVESSLNATTLSKITRQKPLPEHLKRAFFALRPKGCTVADISGKVADFFCLDLFCLPFTQGNEYPVLTFVNVLFDLVNNYFTQFDAWRLLLELPSRVPKMKEADTRYLPLSNATLGFDRTQSALFWFTEGLWIRGTEKDGDWYGDLARCGTEDEITNLLRFESTILTAALELQMRISTPEPSHHVEDRHWRDQLGVGSRPIAVGILRIRGMPNVHHWNRFEVVPNDLYKNVIGRHAYYVEKLSKLAGLDVQAKEWDVEDDRFPLPWWHDTTFLRFITGSPSFHHSGFDGICRQVNKISDNIQNSLISKMYSEIEDEKGENEIESKDLGSSKAVKTNLVKVKVTKDEGSHSKGADGEYQCKLFTILLEKFSSFAGMGRAELVYAPLAYKLSQIFMGNCFPPIEDIKRIGELCKIWLKMEEKYPKSMISYFETKLKLPQKYMFVLTFTLFIDYITRYDDEQLVLKDYAGDIKFPLRHSSPIFEPYGGSRLVRFFESRRFNLSCISMWHSYHPTTKVPTASYGQEIAYLLGLANFLNNPSRSSTTSKVPPMPWHERMELLSVVMDVALPVFASLPYDYFPSMELPPAPTSEQDENGPISTPGTQGTSKQPEQVRYYAPFRAYYCELLKVSADSILQIAAYPCPSVSQKAMLWIINDHWRRLPTLREYEIARTLRDSMRSRFVESKIEVVTLSMLVNKMGRPTLQLPHDLKSLYLIHYHNPSTLAPMMRGLVRLMRDTFWKQPADLGKWGSETLFVVESAHLRDICVQASFILAKYARLMESLLNSPSEFERLHIISVEDEPSFKDPKRYEKHIDSPFVSTFDVPTSYVLPEDVRNQGAQTSSPTATPSESSSTEEPKNNEKDDLEPISVATKSEGLPLIASEMPKGEKMDRRGAKSTASSSTPETPLKSKFNDTRDWGDWDELEWFTRPSKRASVRTPPINSRAPYHRHRDFAMPGLNWKSYHPLTNIVDAKTIPRDEEERKKTISDRLPLYVAALGDVILAASETLAMYIRSEHFSEIRRDTHPQLISRKNTLAPERTDPRITPPLYHTMPLEQVSILLSHMYCQKEAMERAKSFEAENSFSPHQTQPDRTKNHVGIETVEDALPRYLVNLKDDWHSEIKVLPEMIDFAWRFVGLKTEGSGTSFGLLQQNTLTIRALMELEKENGNKRFEKTHPVWESGVSSALCMHSTHLNALFNQSTLKRTETKSKKKKDGIKFSQIAIDLLKNLCDELVQDMAAMFHMDCDLKTTDATYMQAFLMRYLRKTDFSKKPLASDKVVQGSEPNPLPEKHIITATHSLVRERHWIQLTTRFLDRLVLLIEILRLRGIFDKDDDSEIEKLLFDFEPYFSPLPDVSGKELKAILDEKFPDAPLTSSPARLQELETLLKTEDLKTNDLFQVPHSHFEKAQKGKESKEKEVYYEFVTSKTTDFTSLAQCKRNASENASENLKQENADATNEKDDEAASKRKKANDGIFKNWRYVFQAPSIGRMIAAISTMFAALPHEESTGGLGMRVSYYCNALLSQCISKPLTAVRLIADPYYLSFFSMNVHLAPLGSLEMRVATLAIASSSLALLVPETPKRKKSKKDVTSEKIENESEELGKSAKTAQEEEELRTKMVAYLINVNLNPRRGASADDKSIFERFWKIANSWLATTYTNSYRPLAIFFAPLLYTIMSTYSKVSAGAVEYGYPAAPPQRSSSILVGLNCDMTPNDMIFGTLESMVRYARDIDSYRTHLSTFYWQAILLRHEGKLQKLPEAYRSDSQSDSISNATPSSSSPKSSHSQSVSSLSAATGFTKNNLPVVFPFCSLSHVDEIAQREAKTPPTTIIVDRAPTLYGAMMKATREVTLDLSRVYNATRYGAHVLVANPVPLILLAHFGLVDERSYDGNSRSWVVKAMENLNASFGQTITQTQYMMPQFTIKVAPFIKTNCVVGATRPRTSLVSYTNSRPSPLFRPYEASLDSSGPDGGLHGLASKVSPGESVAPPADLCFWLIPYNRPAHAWFPALAVNHSPSSQIKSFLITNFEDNAYLHFRVGFATAEAIEKMNANLFDCVGDVPNSFGFSFHEAGSFEEGHYYPVHARIWPMARSLRPGLPNQPTSHPYVTISYDTSTRLIYYFAEVQSEDHGQNKQINIHHTTAVPHNITGDLIPVLSCVTPSRFSIQAITKQ